MCKPKNQQPVVSTMLRPKEVAEILSLSKQRVYQLCAAGILPSIRIGRSIRIPALEFEAWVETRTKRDCGDDDVTA